MTSSENTHFITLLGELAKEAHANSRAKGFWNVHENLRNGGKSEEDLIWKLSRLALMHSELSECAEGIRKDLKDDHLPHRSMEVAELSDAVIRILDYCGAYNLPLAEVILEKMTYNSGREFMHGKKA